MAATSWGWDGTIAWDSTVAPVWPTAGHLPSPQPLWAHFREWTSDAAVSLLTRRLHFGRVQDCPVTHVKWPFYFYPTFFLHSRTRGNLQEQLHPIDMTIQNNN